MPLPCPGFKEGDEDERVDVAFADGYARDRDAGRASWWCAGGARPGDPAHVPAGAGEMDTIHRLRRPNRKRREPR